MNRLINLFNNLKLNANFKKPDLIVLRKNLLINNYALIDENLYCKIKNYDNLEVYVLKNFNICK